MYTNPEEWYDACVAKHKSGNIDEAISMLNELLEKYPEYALAHAALGVYYTKKEEFDKAMEHSEKYCEWAPDDPFGYAVLSSLAIRLGRKNEAEEALMKARELMFR